MPFCSFREEKIFYRDTGSGRAVILIHGFLESSSIWARIMRDFKKQYRLIAPDLPGHGQSSCLGYTHSMELMADAVSAVARHCGIRRAVVIGHSMGGYVSLALAEQHSTLIAGLVLLQSTSSADTDQKKHDRQRAIEVVRKNRLRYLKESLRKLFNPAFPHLEQGMQWMMNLASETGSQGITAALRGMIERPERDVIIRFGNFKTIYIAGQHDQLLPVSRIEQEANELKAGFVKLSKSGHLAFLEEPDELVRILRSIIYRLYRDPL